MTAGNGNLKTRGRFNNRLDRLAALLKRQSPGRTIALLEHLEMTESSGRTMTQVLRDAIIDSNLSFCRLAEASGVDKGQIARFMKGTRDLTLGTADKLAASLGLNFSPSLTFSREEEEPKAGTARTTKASKTPALTPETTPKTADSLAPKKTPKVVGIVPGIVPAKATRHKGDDIK